MEQVRFNKLLLKTAFSCMACDGDIDKREIILIKKIHQENKFFGEVDISQELENLLFEINRDGQKFLKSYFDELALIELNEEDELKLIQVAIYTIKADEKVEYSEIKFFKVIRSLLDISNESILAIHPDFGEYLEQDIVSDSYLSKLQNNFFDNQILLNLQASSLNDIIQDIN